MEFQETFILISDTPFGDLQVRYYGIIIVFAMLVGAWMASRLVRQRGYDADHIWGGLTWAIFPGIVGARLWYILFPPLSLVEGCGIEGGVCLDTAWFFENFFNLENGAIAVWSGGLHIFGAFLGGLLGIWLYTGGFHNTIARLFHIIFLPINIIFAAIGWVFTMIYERVRGEDVTPFRVPPFETNFPDDGMPLLPWLDFAAIGLVLAHAIGRWANFVNQELYGTPTDLPWGIQIDGANRVSDYASMVEYPAETGFHPLFLYESLWNFMTFFGLVWLLNRYRRKLITGDIFLIYLMMYTFVRFLLEFLRIEKAFFPGTDINMSQVGAAVVFVLALAFFLYRRRNGVEAAQAELAPAVAKAKSVRVYSESGAATPARVSTRVVGAVLPDASDRDSMVDEVVDTVEDAVDDVTGDND
ncbi:MAG: prolipoprotein diacylglyceryl transferase [Aggregatilineales bacterium]